LSFKTSTISIEYSNNWPSHKGANV
jgi:hypothetical protein